MNPRKKKRIFFAGMALIVVALGIGVFSLVMSYKMSLIPSMSFEEMMAYTTENNENAVISVGIIKSGEMSISVYGNNMVLLPKEEHLYEIGSITKTFTTALLCKAIVEGRIELSDTIDEYIELPKNVFYPNLERLATHTSGYRNYYFESQMFSNVLHGQKNDFYGIDSQKMSDRIQKLTVEDKVYDFEYSNFGIAIIGSVLEEIYSSDYTVMMNDFIRLELNLPHTSIAEGTGDFHEYWNWSADDAYIPAGAIISNMGDMLKYMKLHMSEELPYLSLGHEALVHVDATSKQHGKMGIRIDSVGTGWMIDELNNLIWHNGGTDEFNSYIAFDKENQVGVVILSNLPPGYRIPATVMGVKLITTLKNN